MKWWVCIRKSNSGEKLNEHFVHDPGVLLYVLYKLMLIQVSDFASWVCTGAWMMDILGIFAKIDAFQRL